MPVALKSCRCLAMGRLKLFLKDQQSGGLSQRAVLASHLALQLVVPALQIAQRSAGLALLGGAGCGRLAGGAKGIAPLDQLVLEQALLRATQACSAGPDKAWLSFKANSR